MRQILIFFLFLGSSLTWANEVEIVKATASESKGGWTVNVTLNHKDVDRNHFADQWRILTKDGEVLAVKELGHPHMEQPFTRNLKEVKIPDSVQVVYIEAHDKVHGWAKKKYKLSLNN